MKLNYKETGWESSAQESRGFGVHDMSKLFRIFAEEMYSNKPWSITKEIWQNALDAHIEAGKADTPFDVSFPTLFDPNFRTRDYGNSMSHEFMLGNYTLLGFSTKDQSDEFNGAFGLGRLTPLSYVDSYNVTTYIDGVARYYMVSKTDNGAVCSFAFEEPTDQPNGTEVSFPLKNQDVKDFKSAAEVVSIGFDVRPTITNTNDIEWPILPVSIEGDGYKLLDINQLPHGHNMRSCAYVRMGCVVYPLNNAPYGTLEPDSIKNLPLLLDVPIGSLNVTSSRESLSYTEKTIQTLKDSVERIKADLRTNIEEQIKDCDTLYEASKKFRTVSSTSLRTFNLSSSDFVWQGKKLFDPYYLQDSLFDAYGVEVKVVTPHGPGYSVASRTVISFYNNTKVIILVENVSKKNKDKNVLKRVKAKFGDYYSNTYLIWFKFDDQDRTAAHRLLALTSDWPFEVVQVSDLPEVTNTTKKNVTRHVKKLEYGSLTNVNLTQDQFDEGGIYVPICHNDSEVKTTEKRLSLRSSESFLLKLFELEKEKKMLYVYVNRGLQKQFDEAKQWVNLQTIVDKYFTDANRKECHRLQLQYEKHRVSQSFIIEDIPYLKEVPALSGPEITLMSCLSYLFNSDPVSDKTNIYEEFKKKKEKLFEKYPLLRYYQTSNKQHFLDYMKLVDSKGEN